MADNPDSPNNAADGADKPDDPGDNDRSEAGDRDDAEGHDVLLVHSKTKDGAGIHALRSRPGRLEAAELRPVREGQPIGSGEIVALRDREGSPLLWDVDVLYDKEEQAAAGRAGPPRVSNARYRRNWDVVFGPGTTPDKKTLN